MPNENPPLTDLAIYLLKDDVTAATAIEHRQGVQSLPIKFGQTEAELLIRRREGKAPRWSSFFAGKVEPGVFGLVNGVSAVVLVESSGRMFALAFGQGRHILAADCWEERFGLRVALNSLDPAKIRSVDKQALDSSGKQARVQSNRETKVTEFGIDIEQDLLRAVTGPPKDERLGRIITGMDALRTRVGVNPDDVPKLLKRYLDRSQDNAYKTDFPWVDQISEVRSDTTVSQLNKELIRHLGNGNQDRIHLAVPSIIDWNTASTFRYEGVGENIEHSDLDVAQLSKALADDGRTWDVDELRRIRISAVDTDGRMVEQWTLARCIHGDLEWNRGRYVISGGRWFKVEANFVEQVDKTFRDIPRWPAPLPEYSDGCEQAYCKRVSQDEQNWFLMDRRTIQYGGGHSKVEFCDLYDVEQRTMLHVKRYSGSAPLSHLCFQAMVAGETFKIEPTFRQQVNDLLPTDRRLADPHDVEGYKVALGIIRKGSLQLPFFAKVSLRQAVKRLTGFGFEVSLAHIPISTNTAMTKKARKRPTFP